MSVHCHYGLKEDSSPYLEIFLDLYENLSHVANTLHTNAQNDVMYVTSQRCGIVHPCCTLGD